MPRFGSVCDDSVCRVPNPTSFSTTAFIRAASTARADSATLASGGGNGGTARALADMAANGKARNARIGNSPRRLPAKRRSVEQGRIFVDAAARRVGRSDRASADRRGNSMLRALLLALLFIAAPAVAQTPQAALD